MKKSLLPLLIVLLLLTACGSEMNDPLGGAFQADESRAVSAADTQPLFTERCAGCHNVGVSGNLFDLAGDGSKLEGKFGGGAFHNGNVLTPEEITELAAYLDGDVPAPPADAGTPPAPETESAGSSLFASLCARCHNVGMSGNLFDLAGDGSKLQGKFGGGAFHNGNVLTPEEIIELAAYLDGDVPAVPPLSEAGAEPACGTCHGVPPTDNGHSVHAALAGIGADCAVCHTNNTHMNGWVDIGIDSAYFAKGRTAADNPDGTASCVNVSCHGGQTTPMWNSTLDVDTQCSACHVLGSSAATPQFNSYYSGRHRKHVVEEGFACTVCHNTSALAEGHFARLATPELEGLASRTIGGGSTLVTSYNPNGTCAASCHGTGKGSW